MNKDAIAQQVLHNCRISDAQYAGTYSICGLAMRLRDLFKWEHDLPPWIEKDASEILDWIETKETLWEKLITQPYAPVRIQGQAYDPFDTAGINKVLAGEQLFYGAGFAHSMKPSFLLADVLRTQTQDQRRVVHLGREHARDLLTLPAFSQDNQVIVRQDAVRMYLWDQLLYINRSARPALDFALQKEGIQKNRPMIQHKDLPQLTRAYTQLIVQHEIGELEETIFPQDLWRQILATYPHSVIEHLARTLKDLLADTGRHGPLNRMVAERNETALGLYLAFRQGLAAAIFPELNPAFEAYCRDSDWEHITRARSSGFEKARVYTQLVCDLFLEGREKQNPQQAAEAIVQSMRERNLI